MAGYRDSIDNEARSYAKHAEYDAANRAYTSEYGKLEDYRDGYRQGFEAGYDTGFEKRSFESAVPAGLAPRGLVTVARQSAATVQPEITATAEPSVPVIEERFVEPVTSAIVEVPTANVAPVTTSTLESAPVPVEYGTAATPITQDSSNIRKVSYQVDPEEPMIIILKDTELIIELETPLNTDTNRVGDRFTATIVSPVEISGAKIEGRVDKIVEPGRLKRRPEMNLSFDRIVISERRWSNFNAMLTEVIPVRGDNVRMVDDEGTAIGKRDLKGDGIKVGASTGAGLGLGALFGGPVGAAVGAGVGAAFGAGVVVVERGKHIKLNQNQQLRIKTVYETQIR
ncbi:MAG: hypothetical protein H0V76_01505 [Blastocatellia bacterium]|nr:hypothetical protein [Blastocatellia bacterium]